MEIIYNSSQAVHCSIFIYCGSIGTSCEDFPCGMNEYDIYPSFPANYRLPTVQLNENKSSNLFSFNDPTKDPRTVIDNALASKAGS